MHDIWIGDYVFITAPKGHDSVDGTTDFEHGKKYEVLDVLVDGAEFEIGAVQDDEEYYGEIGLKIGGIEVFYVSHKAVELIPKVTKIFVKEK